MSTPATAAALLRPEVLASLSTLELVARSAVEGFFQGMHRSPRFGFSQEFAEYRAYSEGDDPRFVDWNVFARTDRTYIRRYIGETNTRLMIAMDVSASMGYSSGPVSKLKYAKFLAATLAMFADLLERLAQIGLAAGLELVQLMQDGAKTAGAAGGWTVAAHF